MQDVFESEIRSKGDLAGVFEADGETSYFYLYSVSPYGNSKILESIFISANKFHFTQDSIKIRWSIDENFVALAIDGQIWAAFDCKGRAKFGGDYRPNSKTNVPLEIISCFSAI